MGVRTFLLILVLNGLYAQVLPVPFASELNPYPSVRDLAISPNGQEVYFTVQPPLGEIAVIMRIEKTFWGWSKAEIASFSGQFMDLEPFMTADGLRLYFVSQRPLEPDATEAKDYDIWYVEREELDAPWSAPINPGAPINSEHNEFYPSLAKSGNLYFTSDMPRSLGKDDIFVSVYNQGGYLPPVSVSSTINSEGYEFNAFVAWDESYLIFTGYNKPDGLGSGDLYISYRSAQGEWSKPKNLGAAVNSKQMDYCPTVFGQILFFTSRRSAFSKETSPRQDSEGLLDQLNQYENGQSRLYQVAFSAQEK